VPGTNQVIHLDRMHLTDGQDYSMRLFVAQRHNGASALHLRTNIELRDEPDLLPTISLLFD
jgi:fibro-slime domain-containing protein